MPILRLSSHVVTAALRRIIKLEFLAPGRSGNIETSRTRARASQTKTGDALIVRRDAVCSEHFFLARRREVEVGGDLAGEVSRAREEKGKVIEEGARVARKAYEG